MKQEDVCNKLELTEEQMEEIKEYMAQVVKAFVRDEFFFEVRKQMKAVIKETLYEPLDEKIIGLFKQIDKNVNKSLEKIDKSSNETIFELNKIMEVNKNVEEYIANLLLAINQNEYLQAWYPAQKGYPEMKVVGKHPSKKNDKLAS